MLQYSEHNDGRDGCVRAVIITSLVAAIFGCQTHKNTEHSPATVGHSQAKTHPLCVHGHRV